MHAPRGALGVRTACVNFVGLSFLDIVTGEMKQSASDLLVSEI